MIFHNTRHIYLRALLQNRVSLHFALLCAELNRAEFTPLANYSTNGIWKLQCFLSFIRSLLAVLLASNVLYKLVDVLNVHALRTWTDILEKVSLSKTTLAMYYERETSWSACLTRFYAGKGKIILNYYLREENEALWEDSFSLDMENQFKRVYSISPGRFYYRVYGTNSVWKAVSVNVITWINGLYSAHKGWKCAIECSTIGLFGHLKRIRLYSLYSKILTEYLCTKSLTLF